MSSSDVVIIFQCPGGPSANSDSMLLSYIISIYFLFVELLRQSLSICFDCTFEIEIVKLSFLIQFSSMPKYFSHFREKKIKLGTY